MSHFSGKGDLTVGEIKGHLIRLSIPSVWGILAIISFQLVDTYFISRLGTLPLEAVGFTFPVTMTVFSLIIGLGIGTSSVLSRKIGGGNHDEVVRIATHAILLAVIGGLTFTVTGLAVMRPLFRALGADAAMLEIITQYMSIWFAGIVFITVPVVGNSAIRATGDTRTPAMILMTAAGLNAMIGPFLIFGLAGAPRLEVRGAALATVLSYMIALCASLYVLYRRKKLIFQGSAHLAQFGNSARQILFVALPAGIAGIIQPVTQAVITALLAGYSIQAVAAYGVASRLEAMAFVLIIALATGMSPIIGQNTGAGQRDRVQETLRLALGFSVGWSLFIALVLGLFAAPLARIFSQDPLVVRDTMLYFWIVPVSYAAGNLVQGWASAYNAMGQPKKSLLMIVVRTLVLQIPLAMFFGRLWGAPGVFAAISIVNIATGLFYHFRNWSDLHSEPLEEKIA